MYFIFFVPGEYNLTVTSKYWTPPNIPSGGNPPNDNYHTKIGSINMMVDTPQMVIMFGAILGGLFSYFLLPQARRKFVGSMRSDERYAALRKVFREVMGIIGAGLLSAMVVILLARISETQFLIRVTVSDFWGAIAIGFVANYVGVEILDQIAKKYRVNPTTGQGGSTVPSETEKGK